MLVVEVRTGLDNHFFIGLRRAEKSAHGTGTGTGTRQGSRHLFGFDIIAIPSADFRLFLVKTP